MPWVSGSSNLNIQLKFPRYLVEKLEVPEGLFRGNLLDDLEGKEFGRPDKNKENLNFTDTVQMEDRPPEIDIDLLTPSEFEELVSEIWSHRGYETEVTPKSGDRGIDVIAKNSKERVGIQVKKQESKVGEPAVTRLLGCKSKKELGYFDKLVFVTMSSYSYRARELEKEKSYLRLVNGDELYELVERYF